jgi:hypothetical protein
MGHNMLCHIMDQENIQAWVCGVYPVHVASRKWFVRHRWKKVGLQGVGIGESTKCTFISLFCFFLIRLALARDRIHAHFIFGYSYFFP